MSTDKKIAKLFSHRVKRFEVNTSGPGRHAPPRLWAESSHTIHCLTVTRQHAKFCSSRWDICSITTRTRKLTHKNIVKTPFREGS